MPISIFKKINIFLVKISRFVFLRVFLVAIFSLVVLPGYNIFVSDHAIYLPVVFKTIDHMLFNRDILLSFNQSTFTLFDELVVFVTKIFNGNIVASILFLTLFFRAIFIYAIFRITFYFSKNNWLSWIAVFLSLPGFIVYGTVSSTFDVFLTPRLISTALGLLCLAGLLEKKYWLATISLIISAVFHPLTAFVFGVIFYFSLFFDCNLVVCKKKSLSLLPVFCVLILIIAIYFFWPGILIVMDNIWIEIIKDRNPSVFILAWPKEYTGALIYLLVSFLIFLIAKVELQEIIVNERKKTFFSLFFWVPLFLFFLSFIFVDLLKLSFFAQFQLSRALLIWKIFTPILILLIVNNFLRVKLNSIFFVFSLLGLSVSFVFKESLVFIFFPTFFVFWLNYHYSIIKFLSFKALRSVLLIVFILLIGVLLWWWKQHAYLDNIFNLIATLVISGLLTYFYFFDCPLFVFKNFFLVMIIFIFIFKIWSFNIQPVCQRDSADIGLQKWIETNTTKDSLFLTEPFTSQEESSIIRLCTLRNVFFSRKDGAQVVYNRGYALEWQKRRELINDLGRHPEKLWEFSKLYQVDYILSEEEISSDIIPEFSNHKYFIYSLP